MFAAVFAASVFTCAAGVGWIDERAATTGRTGSWSESVAYDSVTHAAAICDNVFTPNAPSAGNFVTLELEAVFGGRHPADPPDATTQGGLNLGTNGCFQVLTRGGWLDVSANGIKPTGDKQYRVSFVFDYAGGKYSVSVMDGKGTWRPLKSATGAQSFPMAAPGYMLRAVHFDGCTEFTSMKGSYKSFNAAGNRTGTIERSFNPNENQTGTIERSFDPAGNRTGTIEQSFNPNENQTGTNGSRLPPPGTGRGQPKGILSETETERSKKWVQN